MPPKKTKGVSRKKRGFRKYPQLNLKSIKMLLSKMGISPSAMKYNDYTDDFSVGTYSIKAAGASAPFNVYHNAYPLLVTRIAVGTQLDDRTTNQILVKKISFRANLQAGLNISGANEHVAPYSVRWMVIQDLQQISDDTALLGDADGVLGMQAVLQQAGGTTDWLALSSFYNVTGYRGRFRVLYDKTFRFSGQQFLTATSTTDNMALKDINIHHAIKFKRGLEQTYNGDNAGDIQKNGIYFLIFSDNQKAATSPCNISLNVRTCFKDNSTR